MMKRLLIIPVLSALLYGSQDLSLLIEAAHKNELVDVYVQQKNVASLSRDSLKSSYFPRVDLGASANIVDETGTIDVGQTYSAYAKASVVVFDGFRRENALDESSSEIDRSESELKGYKKSLSLQVTQAYFNLLNVYSDIDAQEQSHKQLEEELKRQKRFFEARIVTEEEVERINAALANAQYAIVTLQYSADELTSTLNTLTGLSIEKLEESHLIVPQYEQREELDSITALRHQSKATSYAAQQSIASYYPSLSVEDTYSFYDYQDIPAGFPIDRVDQQNRLMIVANINLFDFSSASKQKQSILAQKHAIESQIAYEQKLADANVILAKKAIERTKVLLEAANSSLVASQKTFDAIEKKYQAKIVDYVKYLDALYQKRDAHAQFNRAKNAQQLAYAQYYYYSGFDIKEYIR